MKSLFFTYDASNFFKENNKIRLKERRIFKINYFNIKKS